jgi:hypothetical protein
MRTKLFALPGLGHKAHHNKRTYCRALLISVLAAITITSTRLHADTGTCGGQIITLPFNDVMGSGLFCQIAEAYFSGLTNGTTATTYSPTATVTREQMAAFITRTLDQGLRRGSRRAALGQWATPTSVPFTSKTTVGDVPSGVRSDGADLWVANYGSGAVSQVQASNGKLLGTWTGADSASDVLIARGRVFVTGAIYPLSKLYVINPQQAPGTVTTLVHDLPDRPISITFDGFYIWTANYWANSISKINPNSGAHTDFAGFSGANGIIFDGSFLWVSSYVNNQITKVDLNGTPLLSLPTGSYPGELTYDGVNIWVPNKSANSLTVIRVSDSQGNPLATPFVLATLTGNGLAGPRETAFDGQRIMVANYDGNSVSLWRATDLTPLGSFTGAPGAWAVCSDGINFWITLSSDDSVARF